MFVIQCDRCGQSNDGTADRCVSCSASFAPPTLTSRAQSDTYLALHFFVISLFWFFALSDAADDPRPRSWRGASFFGTLYLLFGIWPPVILWWIGGGLFLLNARRLRRAATFEAAQSHSVVAAGPTNASSVSARGNAARVYWSLAGLVAVIAALCVLTTLVGMAPILPPNTFSKWVAYGFSALAGALVIAGLVLMTRVPQRAFTQSTIEVLVVGAGRECGNADMARSRKRGHGCRSRVFPDRRSRIDARSLHGYRGIRVVQSELVRQVVRRLTCRCSRRRRRARAIRACKRPLAAERQVVRWAPA